jgi:surface protein
MFKGTRFFNQPLNNWNTSSVIDMSFMFDWAFKFDQPIGNWDVSKVTNMSYMFANDTFFNQPIGYWNTGNVKKMEMMFWSSRFNQPINNWNTNSVTDIQGMFGWDSIFNQPLNNWNTANVRYMKKIFYYAKKFNQNIGSWNIENVDTLIFINTTYPYNSIDLSYSGIETNNYDSILIGWSKQHLKQGFVLDAYNLKYCISKNLRDSLINKGYIIKGDTIDNSCTLPIHLTSFTATPQQNKVLLQWQTATEINNNYFTVQRSSNSDNWYDIATIKDAGNSSVVKKYTSTDNSPLQGISYYRIKQTDFNGSFSYSEVRSVELGIRNLGISVYPNPASNELHINTESKATFKMFNAIGKQIITSNLTQGDNNINIQQLSQGVYVAVIETANGVVTKKVIKE